MTHSRIRCQSRREAKALAAGMRVVNDSALTDIKADIHIIDGKTTHVVQYDDADNDPFDFTYDRETGDIG